MYEVSRLLTQKLREVQFKCLRAPFCAQFMTHVKFTRIRT